MNLKIKYSTLLFILLINVLMAIEPIDLSTKDIYIRKGFHLDWVNQHPKETGKWHKIPGVSSGGQSLGIRNLELPDVARHTLFSLKNSPAESFTYIIPIEIGSTIHKSREALGLYLVGIAYNWEIFFNGVSIENKIYTQTNGHLDNPIRGKNKIIPVPNNIIYEGENYLTIHFVSSPNYLGTGMYYNGPYLFGPLSELMNNHRPNVFQYGLVWFYLVIGLFWLYMYLKIPNKTNYLLFAGWTFCISLYNLGRVDHLTVWFNEGLLGFRIEYFGMFLSSFFFFAFIMDTIYHQFTKPSRIALNYFGGLTFFCFWAPIPFLNDLLRLWEVTVPIAILILAYHLVQHVSQIYNNKSSTKIFLKEIHQYPIIYFLIGAFVLFGFLLTDIALNLFYNMKSSFNTIGFLFFTISISGTVFKDFIDAHLKSESFNEELEQEVLKRTQEFKDAKSRIESIFNTSSNGLALFDLNLNLIQCNQSHLDLFGYTIEEYNNLKLENFYSKKRVKTLLKYRAEIINGEKKKFDFIVPVRRKDGKMIQVSIFASLIQRNNEPIGFVSDMRDITKEKYAQGELQKTTNELMGIFHAIPDLVFKLNNNGHILNYKAENLADLYLDPEKFLGKRVPDILPPDSAKIIMDGVHETLIQNNIVTVEYSLPKMKNSETIEYYEARMLPVANNQVLCIIRNITRRIQADESIRSYQKQLKNLSQKSLKMLEDERSRISHELHDEVGQALSAVNLNLQHIKLKMDKQDAKSQSRIDDCQSLVQNTADNIHRFSFELRPSILDDLGLVPAMKAHARSYTDRTGINVNLSGDKSIHYLDDQSRTTLYRVFQESLTNVSKYAKATKVDASVTLNNESILLIIKDNGIGFSSSQSLENNNVKGLGITGMKERVEHSDGTFILHSELGHGTEIIAQLPYNKSGVSNEK
ncbi:MAG: PAS domain S-box protein [Candidatus Marinimicrobia bacterium]|nr:PAS domain S-box protein [Candidatus Neomarinimicrobiota bacterium]